MSDAPVTSETPGDAAPAAGRLDGQRQRHELIRRRVTAEGFVRIASLTEELRVSAMTIHRDLELLESQGWLRKVRGGATAQPSAFYHGDVRHRMQTGRAEKAALARHAERLLVPGQALILDDSTTVLEFAHRLPAHGPFTVITNFLSTMNVLAGEEAIDMIALGGTYYPAYDSFLGLQTVQSVQGLRADVLFMSTTAIARGSCYHQSQETIQVKRALMEAAARRVLLVDHTKFTRHAVHALAPLEDFDLVVVDAVTPDDVVAGMRMRGVAVEVAEAIEPAADAAG